MQDFYLQRRTLTLWYWYLCFSKRSEYSCHSYLWIHHNLSRSASFMCVTFEQFILMYSPLCHVWTQSLSIKHLEHLEYAMKWSQLFLCRKLRARTPNQNPVQDQLHLESEGEVRGSWSSLTLWHFSAFLFFLGGSVELYFRFLSLQVVLPQPQAGTDRRTNNKQGRRYMERLNSIYGFYELTSHSSES